MSEKEMYIRDLVFDYPDRDPDYVRWLVENAVELQVTTDSDN